MMLLLAHLKGQAQQITLHVERAGTLPGMIDESRLPYITDLKLTGELNGTDIRLIRTLTQENLQILDLSEARILGGGAPYKFAYYTSNDIIGEYMFYNSDYYGEKPSVISKIILPKSTLRIDKGAFRECKKLESIDISNSVTSIGDLVFCGCTRLTNIDIPNSVTSIGENTFSECTSLKSINISNSLTSIGSQTFYECDNLKSIYLNSSNPPTINKTTLPQNEDLTIYIPRGSYTAYWLSYWGNYNLVEYDPTDIQGVTTSAHNSVKKYFSIDGRPLPGPCKGVNIIQDTDGKTRKAWIP